MPDPTPEPTPPDTPSPRPQRRRTRRFTMPEAQHDERVSERIEAFLEGPARPRRRQRHAPSRPHAPIRFDTRTDWDHALRQEDARMARYGRPATVVILEFAAHLPPADADRLAEPVADAIRHEARETDRVARVSATRFHLLLPETAEVEADRLAQRLAGACHDRVNGDAANLRLRIESVSPSPGAGLVDALAVAEQRLAD